MALQKARIKTLHDNAGPGEVQFNPTTLQFSLSAHLETSANRAASQETKYPSMSMSVELVFDTADEGTTEAPRSVREKTRAIEALVVAPPDASFTGDKRVAPAVEFAWGDFSMQGIVSAATVTLELFSATGLPLRAKVALTITGRDPNYVQNRTGAGANKAGDARPPGKAGLGAVGGIAFGAGASLRAGFSAGGGLALGIGASAQAGVALGGESVAEFATRMGMDPAAWRGVATGQLENTLSLSAGAEIAFDASVSASAGMGASAGAQADSKLSLDAAFGLSADTSSRAAPGFALSAAGGVYAALSTVDVVRSERAATSTRRAFNQVGSHAASSRAGQGRGLASVPRATAAAILAPSDGAPVRPTAVEQPRTPLALDASAIEARRRALPAPRPPQPDQRAVTFGLGIPLRPRVGGAVPGSGGPRRSSTPGSRASCTCGCRARCSCGSRS